MQQRGLLRCENTPRSLSLVASSPSSAKSGAVVRGCSLRADTCITNVPWKLLKKKFGSRDKFDTGVSHLSKRCDALHIRLLFLPRSGHNLGLLCFSIRTCIASQHPRCETLVAELSVIKCSSRDQTGMQRSTKQDYTAETLPRTRLPG